MKNLLFLGVIALLLFCLSAALSLWLNQTRQPQDTAEKEKALPKADLSKVGEPKEKDAPDSKNGAKTTPTTPPGPTADGLAAERQEKLERKAVQVALVLQDLQAQREATDALLRQVAAELKVASKSTEIDAAAAEAAKKKAELDVTAKSNYVKLAALYDAMTPEGGAKLLQEMAEAGTGKMEQAAQILALMKERNAAKLLEAMTDTSLAGQLTRKVLTLKGLNGPASAPPPSPAGIRPVSAP